MAGEDEAVLAARQALQATQHARIRGEVDALAVLAAREGQ